MYVSITSLYYVKPSAILKPSANLAQENYAGHNLYVPSDYHAW